MKAKTKNTKIVMLTILVLVLISICVFVKKYIDRKKIINALESMECTYIGANNSKEKDYSMDIFASIPYKPVDSVMHSNQEYYENLIKTISVEIKNKNFRLIDEKKELMVSVKNKNGDLKYTINGNNNYYETEVAKISKNNSEQKTIQLNVKAQELEKLIQNNWKIAKVRNTLGTIEKNKNEYECYIDEGYEIRVVNLRVFNIVFKGQYKNEIFDGITTGLSNKEIVDKLGEPLLQSDAKQEIGYKTKDCYVFFYNGEISIYRTDDFDEKKNSEFAELVTQLLENKDFNQFIDKVTDVYPDFDKYYKGPEEIEIMYSIRGISISYSTNGKKGITIYNNYNGKITNDIDSDEIGTTKSLPLGIYYLDIDSVYQNELKRENN